MKGKALIWMCKSCRWITVSDQYPHRMDTCKCGNISVDHEVNYTRFSTNNPQDYMFIALVDMDNNIVDYGKQSLVKNELQKKYKKKKQRRKV